MYSICPASSTQSAAGSRAGWCERHSMARQAQQAQRRRQPASQKKALEAPPWKRAAAKSGKRSRSGASTSTLPLLVCMPSACGYMAAVQAGLYSRTYLRPTAWHSRLWWGSVCSGVTCRGEGRPVEAGRRARKMRVRGSAQKAQGGRAWPLPPREPEQAAGGGGAHPWRAMLGINAAAGETRHAFQGQQAAQHKGSPCRRGRTRR